MSIVPNLIVSVTGRAKHGKTHFALSFPDPIKVYCFNRGADIVTAKFPSKKITVHNFFLPIIEDELGEREWAGKIWSEFYKEFKTDCSSGEYQTLVLDAATEVWAICRQAITEEKNRKKLLEVEYEKPNLRMTSLLNYATNGGVNLVTIQYLKDRYVKGENTGEQELDGWKRTENQADIILEIARVAKGDKQVMRTTVKDNRYDRDLNGLTLDDTGYPELLSLLGV